MDCVIFETKINIFGVLGKMSSPTLLPKSVAGIRSNSLFIYWNKIDPLSRLEYDTCRSVKA